MKGDWSIIDQMDQHVRPEDPGCHLAIGVQVLGDGDHGIEQGAGLFWRGSGAEIRAVAMNPCCQGELGDQQKVTACLPECPPHAAIILGEDAQVNTALQQQACRLGIIATLDAHEDQQSWADGSHRLLLHCHHGRLHALDESNHGKAV